MVNTEPEKVSLEVFIKQLLEEVSEFECVWREGSKTSEESYPDELPFGDWFDQFLSYQ